MREVICADSLPWMSSHAGSGAVVTSLPDADECDMSFDAWLRWFDEALSLSMLTARDDCPAIFYQTDRKIDGRLVSKSQLCHDVAARHGYRCLWHKIVLRRGVGATDLFRPTYTHLIAFSRNGKPGRASPDVMECGRMVYPNAMGYIPARFAVEFCRSLDAPIIDPFCGHGTVLAMADRIGLSSVGLDILPEQCIHARRLTITE